jgi:hypothetical protein
MSVSIVKYAASVLRRYRFFCWTYHSINARRTVHLFAYKNKIGRVLVCCGRSTLTYDRCSIRYCSWTTAGSWCSRTMRWGRTTSRRLSCCNICKLTRWQPADQCQYLKQWQEKRLFDISTLSWRTDLYQRIFVSRALPYQSDVYNKLSSSI